jgi:exodeoxyribonuclease-3
VNAPWRIVTWNVNGLRAAHRKGFATFLARCRCQVLGVQEVRAFSSQLPPGLARPQRWHTHFTAAERPGYSGVGLFSRVEPDEAGSGLGVPRFDVEGRFQWMRFGRLIVANVYFPKGSGRLRDNRRVPYKLDFYRASPAAMRFVTDAFIWPKVVGSDHCPAGVAVDPAICR